MADRKVESYGVSGEAKILDRTAFDPVKPPKRNKYALGCAVLASMTSILLGYDIGVMSGASIYIKDDLKVSDVQIEILIGILNLHSLVGSAAAGKTSDMIGRRYTIVFAAAIFFAGALLMGFATDYSFLMVGRFVAGIGVGYALMIAPVYTAEVSPASSRGFLTSFPEVFINAGILLGYVSNYAFSKMPAHLSWRFMLGIGAVPSVFLALGDARRVLDKTSDSKEEAQLRHLTYFHHSTTSTMANPNGTIIFSTVGRTQYGFDVFSVNLPPFLNQSPTTKFSKQRRLTDGMSVNFNAQFLDNDNQSIVYVSERSGSAQVYLTKPGLAKPQLLQSVPGSKFHDRPIIKNDRLYFISAHQEPDKLFTSWSALYATQINGEKGNFTRLTPKPQVDYSPSISQSGELVAVASYGPHPWSGEFHDLETDIIVFRRSNPEKRIVVCQHGGWPTWSGDSTIYFHRQADDGWWSIFRVVLTDDFDESTEAYAPLRITPPGVHCFTPAAIHNTNQISVATRRPDNKYRHIEVFDVEFNTFTPVTLLLNPDFHHYSPFVSPDSTSLGYHRFRGASSTGESVIPYLEPISSPINGLRMLRINGFFPTFSPDGDLVAYNQGLGPDSGLKIVKSDGSRRWTLLKNRIAFYNVWSPTEKNVIYTSIGPIFATVKATVEIARITFDPVNLTDKCEEVEVDVKILTKEVTGNNAFSSCSPDGRYLVFRSGRSGHKNLYVMDAVNGEFEGEIRQLTDGPWIDTMPSWSPDGKLIAFSSNRHNPKDESKFSIYVVGADGSDLRRIQIAGCDGDTERINHVCFSADGEWMLFAANMAGVTAEPISVPNQFQPYGDLYVVKLDGSGLRRLTWNGYENGTPAWHPRDDVDVGRLSLGDDVVGDELMGKFDEPLWIKCDL